MLALPAPPLSPLLRLKSGGAQIGVSPPQLALGGYAMFRANEHLGGAMAQEILQALQQSPSGAARAVLWP